MPRDGTSTIRLTTDIATSILSSSILSIHRRSSSTWLRATIWRISSIDTCISSARLSWTLHKTRRVSMKYTGLSSWTTSQKISKSRLSQLLFGNTTGCSGRQMTPSYTWQTTSANKNSINSSSHGSSGIRKSCHWKKTSTHNSTWNTTWWRESMSKREQ